MWKCFWFRVNWSILDVRSFFSRKSFFFMVLFWMRLDWLFFIILMCCWLILGFIMYCRIVLCICLVWCWMGRFFMFKWYSLWVVVFISCVLVDLLRVWIVGNWLLLDFFLKRSLLVGFDCFVFLCLSFLVIFLMIFNKFWINIYFLGFILIGCWFFMV